MSTQLAEKMDDKQLAKIEEAMAAKAAELKKKITITSNRISTKDKKFTFPDDNASYAEVNAVVLNWNTRQALYTKAWDPKNPSMPDCWAVGEDPNNMEPSTDCPNPIAAACNACPNFEFGSGSGDSKACKTTRQVVLRVPGRDNLYILTLPPTSIKEFDSVMSSLISGDGTTVKRVLTLAFDPNVSYVKVTYKGQVENPDYAHDFVKSESDAVKEMLYRKLEV